MASRRKGSHNLAPSSEFSPGFAVEVLRPLPLASDSFPGTKDATGSLWSEADARRQD